MGFKPERPDGEENDSIPPWEQREGVRRDCLPHRGPFLQFLGLLAMGLGLASCCLAVPVLVSFPLALVVLHMSRHDVAQMAAGARDPAGKPQTLQAQDWALIGLGLSLGFWVIPSLLVLALMG